MAFLNNWIVYLPGVRQRHCILNPGVAWAVMMLLTYGALPNFAAADEILASTGTLKKLSVEELMNLEVTSVSKRPEKLSAVASAIQVITGDDIRRSGATSLPEALRLASNLEVARIDSRQWAITARGFNNALANKMLVLIDGRTVYTPLYAGVYWDVQDTLLEDVERIEVISGPGATQWGANAVNGVINIITKSAKETQGALLSVGGGTELEDFAGLRYGATTTSGVSYRVYAKYFDRDASELLNGKDAGDAWHMGQGGFRLDWEKDHEDLLTLQGDLYGGAIAQTSAPPLTDNVEVSGGNLLGRWSRTLAPNSDMKLQVYYDNTHRRIPGSFEQDVDTADVDFQHRFPLGAINDIVWGVSDRWVKDDIINAPTLAFFPADVTHQWYGAFAQDDITLIADRWHLTLGTKIEHNDYTGFEWQPSIRSSWTPSAQQTVWAAISRAVRTPSRVDTDLFSPSTAPFLIEGGPNFVSESVLAYELGYRVQSQSKLALSLATFYNDYNDLRSIEPLSPPAAFPVVLANGLQGKSYGAEFTADYHAAEGWRLRLGYTELRAESEPKSGSLDRISTRSVALDPHRQASLRSSLDLPENLETDITLRYVGPIAYQDVPGYTELDLRVGWHPTSNWELSLVGQNLLHAQHPEFGVVASLREIERGIYGKIVWSF